MSALPPFREWNQRARRAAMGHVWNTCVETIRLFWLGDLIPSSGHGRWMFDTLCAGDTIVFDFDPKVDGVRVPDSSKANPMLRVWPHPTVIDKKRGHVSKLTYAGPRGFRALLHFNNKPYEIDMPWAAVTHIRRERDDVQQDVIDRRLVYLMTADRAREIAEQEASDRDSFEVLDTLKRALRSPERFGRYWLERKRDEPYLTWFDRRKPSLAQMECLATEVDEPVSVPAVIRTGDRVIPLLRELMSPTRAHFTVLRCDCGLCASGRHVAVDQESVYGDGWRHFTRAGLRWLPTEPTEAETQALLAYEREQLGFDRRKGEIRRLG